MIDVVAKESCMKPIALEQLHHPFLEGLKESHLKILAENALPARFEAGEVIFYEGEMANRFYLIQKGRVALELAVAEGDVVLIQEIGPGDVLGWSWLFPPYLWRLDARAIEPTEAVFFYGTRLRAASEENHELGFELMKRVAQVVIRRLQATRGELIKTHAVFLSAIGK